MNCPGCHWPRKPPASATSIAELQAWATQSWGIYFCESDCTDTHPLPFACGSFCMQAVAPGNCSKKAACYAQEVNLACQKMFAKPGWSPVAFQWAGCLNSSMATELWRSELKTDRVNRVTVWRMRTQRGNASRRESRQKASSQRAELTRL